jgi:hypothetical protein
MFEHVRAVLLTLAGALAIWVYYSWLYDAVVGLWSLFFN